MYTFKRVQKFFALIDYSASQNYIFWQFLDIIFWYCTPKSSG